MTAPALPRSSFAVLDQQILEALDELRFTRNAAARSAGRPNVDRETRAEARLNALLEYRHAAQGR